jgi:hypothetical protein
MKKYLTALCSLFAITVAQANQVVPDLFTKKELNAATLAQAANHYIDMGETRAIKSLKALGEDHAVRIGLVCRIIFQGNDGKPLRQPRYGGLSLPYLTMPLEQWPLYPVAESEGVFFVLSEGYILGGVAERVTDYIDYCSTTGNFRKTKVEVPTHEEAMRAFDSFKNEQRWKIIKWKDEGPGTKYTISEDWVLRSIEAQAISIPK